jgi:uncharacterized membrane protein YfcA
MSIPTPTLIAGIASIFVAGLTSGLTGFGFALVTVPLLVIFMPPKLAVPVVLLLGNVTKLMILTETHGWLDFKRFWPLIVAGVAATPIGTYVLSILDAQTMKTAIGVIIVLAALAMLAGFQRPVRSEKLSLVPVGLASGLLQGSTAMGGPPTVLFFANQGADKQICRANFTLFFLAMSLVAIPAQLAAGLLTKQVLVYALWFVPALLAGTLAGMRLARIVSEAGFRKVTLIVVILTGISAIASGLGLL